MRYLLLVLVAAPALAQAPETPKERAIPLWVINKHLMILQQRHEDEIMAIARERDEALRKLFNVEQRTCS